VIEKIKFKNYKIKFNKNMPRKEINNKIVNSLFNQDEIIQDLKEQLKDQIYLTNDKEEFKKVIVEKKENSQKFKYDHVFYLHQLQDSTWGIININQKPGYGNYWFSISNQDKSQKEINNFLNSLDIKCSSYNIDYSQNVGSTGDVIKESATSSIEILENYLSLLKTKGDYGWAWVELKITPKRQQELSEKYDQIDQEIFVEDFQEIVKNERTNANNASNLGLTKDKIIEYWQKGYNREQAWEISKISEELDAEKKAKKDLEAELYQLREFNKWESERKSTQEWFDKKYPEERKKKEDKIIIDGEGLMGELKIEGFDELKEINCFKNKLTSLKITNCPNVKHLNVSCNSLHDFSFLDDLEAEKLTSLSVHSNNFKRSDLTVFSKFINLEELYLDNYDSERISSNTYNRFYGSLEPLKNLTNLRLLNISGTDVNSGLEFLPTNLRKIGCNTFKLGDKDSECSKIKQELKSTAESEGTDEVLKKAEEGDTKWSKDWPRVASWQKKHNLEKLKEGLEKRKMMEIEIRGLKEKIESISVGEKETELEKKKAESKQKQIKDLDREIEKLRKEITGENLVTEHQKTQEEIEIKKQELKDLRREKSSDLTSSLFSLFSSNKSESEKESKNKSKIKEIEEEILRLERKNIVIENDLEASNIVTKAPLTPAWLLNNERKLRENEDIESPLYDGVYPKGSFFLNSWQQGDSFLERKLPTKLFNVRKFWENNEEKIKEGDFKEIEWENYVYKKDEKNNGNYICAKDEKKENIKDYAILSYVWGDTKGEKLGSNWSKKSLLKAVKALEIINQENRDTREKLKNTGSENSFSKFAFFKNLLESPDSEKDINYLWMDQLCIDQNNSDEKAEEVRKMRQYYSDASVTLVVINTRLGGNKIKFSEDGERKLSKSLDLDKILKIVVKSEWFSRSWTFQEGWLGKNTIFMFDNILIDGRDLAANWVLNQPSFTDHAKYDSLEELSKNTRKIATPLGWVRYEGEYNSFDKVTLRLYEALRAIKKRGRAVPIDGIYSILGLLPYGEHVRPNYVKEGDEYTQKELQKALFDVMQVAWENGYGEVLAWHGTGDNWVPNVDSNGKSSIEGGISIDILDLKDLIVSEHKISEVSNDIVKIEGRGYAIDSGACVKNVKISLENDEKLEVTLLSTREILEKVSKNDILLLPSGDGWNSSKPFAVAVKKNSNHRLGLVEVKGEGLEKLHQGAKKLEVKEINDINLDEKLDFEELFEVPPKK